MRAVNLLPRDDQRERFQSVRLPVILGAVGVIACTALAMLLASSASGDTSTSRAELQAVEAEIASLPMVQDAVVSQGTLVRERTDRAAALSAALSTRVPFDRVLRQISFVLPKDAWLTQITATAPTSSAPVAPGAAPPPPAPTPAAGVKIEGATYSHESVARVLARLSVVPSLENVRLTSSARVEPPKPDAAEPQKKSSKKRAKVKRPRPFVTFIVSAALRTGAIQ